MKSVLFDLGNVLLPFSHDKMYEQLSILTGRESEQIKAWSLEQQALQRMDRGEWSFPVLHERFQQWLGRSVDPIDLERAIADIFRRDGEMELITEALKEFGIRLVLISNTCDVHWNWLESRYQVVNHLDDKVLSFKVGHAKPDEAIFRAAIAACGCAPSDILYVDDIERFVEAGRSLGLNGHVFRNASTLRTELQSLGLLPTSFC